MHTQSHEHPFKNIAVLLGEEVAVFMVKAYAHNYICAYEVHVHTCCEKYRSSFISTNLGRQRKKSCTIMNVISELNKLKYWSISQVKRRELAGPFRVSSGYHTLVWTSCSLHACTWSTVLADKIPKDMFLKRRKRLLVCWFCARVHVHKALPLLNHGIFIHVFMA